MVSRWSPVPTKDSREDVNGRMAPARRDASRVTLRMVILPGEKPRVVQRKLAEEAELEFDPETGTVVEDLRKSPRPFRWWVPYGCGHVGRVRVHRPGQGGTVRGRDCGGRGCLPCHRRKLQTSSAAVDLLRVRRDERVYLVTLTPDRPVRTVEEAGAFLSRVRAFLREWEQDHGLGAGWWTAEVTVGEGRSRVRCPVADVPPPALAGMVRRGWSEEAAARVHRMHQDHGPGCHLCSGTGYLPTVHLHAHAVVVARAGWVGRRGDCPPALADRLYLYGRHGGLQSMVEAHGLGRASRTDVARKGKRAAQSYLGKVVRRYVSKVTKEVDYRASQLTAEVASIYYGTRRSRGSHGRLYGARVRQTDATAVARWEPGHVQPEAEPSAAAAVAAGGDGQAAQSRAGVVPTLPVASLALGWRALAALLEAGDLALVVPGAEEVPEDGGPPEAAPGLVPHTQLAPEPGGHRTCDLWHLDRGRWSPRPAPVVQGDRLSPGWRGAPAVPDGAWWTRELRSGLLVGRGGSCLYLHGADVFDAPEVVARAADARDHRDRVRRDRGRRDRRQDDGPPPRLPDQWRPVVLDWWTARRFQTRSRRLASSEAVFDSVRKPAPEFG